MRVHVRWVSEPQGQEAQALYGQTVPPLQESHHRLYVPGRLPGRSHNGALLQAAGQRGGDAEERGVPVVHGDGQVKEYRGGVAFQDKWGHVTAGPRVVRDVVAYGSGQGVEVRESDEVGLVRRGGQVGQEGGGGVAGC